MISCANHGGIGISESRGLLFGGEEFDIFSERP
jgi:hypothetical protein